MTIQQLLSVPGQAYSVLANQQVLPNASQTGSGHGSGGVNAPTAYRIQAMSYQPSQNVVYGVPTPIGPVPGMQPPQEVAGNLGYGRPLDAAQPMPPVSRPMPPLTAIAAYGGYALNDVPGRSGGGFGNLVFQSMNWSQAAQQQRKLPEQIKASR
ncbi:hypothetical protein PI124_g17041 [Phytophthora idaei]|nr:hypothetical protein PI126_g16171 [Phytophthora idaei]KAG3237995.1 hypothetical protein PI124_g17041 [Phytophthora idaei]